mmetsp:Transcript_13879/g.37116  ORF Transcript_13879/g.37116 Transcript_13879/m.37116 type:complete len:94 (+) Transcript_13879:1753-2034(+)
MVAEAVAVEAAGVALVGKEVVEETGAAEAAEGVAEAAPALTLAQHLARRLPSTIKLVRLAQAVFVGFVCLGVRVMGVRGRVLCCMQSLMCKLN